jgi:hypothetical protein
MPALRKSKLYVQKDDRTITLMHESSHANALGRNNKKCDVCRYPIKEGEAIYYDGGMIDGVIVLHQTCFADWELYGHAGIAKRGIMETGISDDELIDAYLKGTEGGTGKL